MATTQAAPATDQGQVKALALGVAGASLDDILDATVRRQSEQVKADKIAAMTYGPGMGLQWEVAALKIAFGRDYGFGPAHSLKYIHIINGSPALESSGRTNLLVKAGYSWKPVQFDDKLCRMEFYRHGEAMTTAKGDTLTVEFSMADAERAGYVESSRGKNAKPGDKGNYDKVPKNMLFARCLANFHRWYAPEVDGSAMADPNEITLENVVSETEQRITAKTESNVDVLRERLTAAKQTEAAVSA